MKNSKKALTMVELMVSMALLAFIFAQVFEAFGVGNRIWDANSNRLIRQKEARNIASYLAKDTRALSSIPVSTMLDSNGDSITFETSAADIDYSLAVSGDSGVLTREGIMIGAHVQSVNITSSSSDLSFDIITYTSSILGGTDTYQLKTKVRRRNEG